MKTCTACGQSKSFDSFSRSKEGAYGRHSVCKVCRNAEGHRLKALREARERAQVELEAELRKVTPREGVALPRTFSHIKDEPWDGKLEPMYVRNSGNKHIPSRGL